MTESNNDVQVTDVHQVGGSVRVETTMEEARAAHENAQTVSHETLGVTEQQFAKYYKDGNYNWQAHARELEFAANQRQGETTRQAEDTEATQTTQIETHQDAQQAVADAGLNWDEIALRAASDGKLADSDYEALGKIGIPRDIIDGYIEAQHTAAAAQERVVMDAFGGEQGFAQVADFVQKNMNEQEISALELALANPATMQMTIDSLKYRMSQAGAAVPQGDGLVNTRMGAWGGQSTTGFGSEAEMIAAMRSPQYRNDPAYRAQVEQRVRASDFSFDSRRHHL